jgi:hypothetical protein
MLVSDYSSLFMAFSFGEGWGSVHPGAELNYFPGVGRWVGEQHMVLDAHLYLLQFNAGSFGASYQGEMVWLFSVWCGIERLFKG